MRIDLQDGMNFVHGNVNIGIVAQHLGQFYTGRQDVGIVLFAQVYSLGTEAEDDFLPFPFTQLVAQLVL